MGQRHQIIVIYPEKNLGKDNGNNRPVCAEVIHHQWLYGRSAIHALDRMLRFCANSWDGKGTDYRLGRSDGYRMDGTRALAAAAAVDLDQGYYHNVDLWKPAEWNAPTVVTRNGYDTKYLEPKNLEPQMFDNNDGVTLLKFEIGQILPSYAFITPGHLEGSHWKENFGRGPWSAMDYLQFYYNADEQDEFTNEVIGGLVTALKRINRAKLLTPDQVHALLPKFEFKVKRNPPALVD